MRAPPIQRRCHIRSAYKGGPEFKNWSGARDLNPGPHGPEPVQWRVLSCPVVSARFLLYSKWIFFVSSCYLVYPPSSVNA